eukprot:4397662-Pyramimonas_sp.AAC.1
MSQLKKKLKSAKNLVYHRESEAVKSGLRLARQDKWGKCRKFDAAVHIDSVKLQHLFDEGCRMVTPQWIESDKDAPLRRPYGPAVARSTRVALSCVEIWKGRWASARIHQHAN